MSGRFPFSTRKMLCTRKVLGLAICACISAATPVAHAATPEQVDAAINRGKEFLYSKMKSGSWEELPAENPQNVKEYKISQSDPSGKQWGGVSSLATLALLASGEGSQDPRMREAIEFLKKADIRGIYALGMRAQVWNLLPQNNEIRQFINRDGSLLLKSKLSDANTKGLHGYFVDYPEKKRVDHSVSQYGVLGLWSCAENGFEVPQGYWADADETWRAHQNEDGGWSYNGIGPKDADPKKKASLASMGAAGVATLFITQDFLRSNAGVTCAGNVENDNINRGLHYMSTVDIGKVDLYTLYGIERIGVASGYKYFGDKEWYDIGAERLVKGQGKNGAWAYKHGGFGNKDGLWATETVGTSFALLFLSRGRAPLVASKLSYDVQAEGKPAEGRWNQRPRDLANVVHWIGKQMERPLNWQIVNLKAPAVELLDSPILYVAGSQALAFTDEEADKLKWFVRQGGMILGNADCASKEFSDSFRLLGNKLFPDYEFRNLPANHSAMTSQQFAIQNKDKLSVLMLGNGAREYMVLLNANDPGKAWQLANVGGKEENFQFMANLFQYAAGKTGLRNKGESFYVAPDKKAKPAKRLAVARLQFDGNWDPEPGGWDRISAILRNTQSTDLTVTAVKLGTGALDPKKFKIAHLTSTDRFKLPEAANAEIKKFVEGGGTLVVDAAGGNPEASRSIEAELSSLFGATGEVLPESDPVYHTPVDVGEVKYRSAARAVLGKLDTGRVRGLTVNGRTAVYYSAEDLSVGLVGQPVDGIIGYVPKTATDLVTNILAGATDAPKPKVTAPPVPATKPATKPAPTKIF